MEDNIKMNNEVNEIMEEAMENGSNSFLKTVGIGTVVLLVGYGAYRFIIKPLAAKIKEKKEQKETSNNVIDYDPRDFDEVGNR